MPLVGRNPDERWNTSKLFAPHAVRVFYHRAKILVELNNIDMARLLMVMGEYNSCVQCNFSKALEFHEKALAMLQVLFPGNHADVATSLSNVGIGYSKVGQYAKALEFWEKALAMRQVLFPGNHADVATSLSYVAVGYSRVGQYAKALE